MYSNICSVLNPLSPLLGNCKDRLAHNSLARVPDASDVLDTLDGNDGQGNSPAKG